MTVKEKTGRRRYVLIDTQNPADFKKLVAGIRNSSMIEYKGIKVLRIKHYQIDELRKIAEMNKISVKMMSGTLHSIHKKVLQF